MGAKNSIGERDASDGRFGRRSGRGQGHESGNTSHGGEIQSAHETTGENDPRYGEIGVQKRNDNISV